MNKRLRKKKHRGEFREFGFHIEVRYEPGYFEPNKLKCFDHFIEELDKAGFETGGGWTNDTYDGYVTLRNCRADIEIKKPELLENIRQLAGVVSVKAGENSDAWYGPFPD